MATLDQYICALPYNGTQNEKLAQWLAANGGTGVTLDSLWQSFLQSQGFSNEPAFYASKGYAGTLNEQRFQFFRDGAPLDFYKTFKTNNSYFSRAISPVGATGDNFTTAYFVRQPAVAQTFYGLYAYGPLWGDSFAAGGNCNIQRVRSDFTSGVLDSSLTSASLFPAGQASLIQISTSRTGPFLKVWRNGVLVLDLAVWAPFGAATALDVNSATSIELGAFGGFASGPDVKIGLFYTNGLDFINTSIFHDGTDFVDPGLDGTFGGAYLQPQFYLSGIHQTVADWNAGTNLGTRGVLTLNGTGFT